MSRHVVVEIARGIGRIELARPERRNALTGEMYVALAGALERMEEEAEVRAVLLHGTPDCFTAGNDLEDFLRYDRSAGEFPAFRFLRTISGARKPIVAAVAGAAVGVGTTMLLHCDLVYAAPSARFRMPFVSLGIVPEAASSLIVPMRAGHARAAELLLLARPFDVEKAAAAGLLTAVVPEGELLATARAAAEELAALPPASVRITKELMRKPLARAVAEQMEEEGRIVEERLGSPETKEAITAFFEKRRPDFSRFF